MLSTAAKRSVTAPEFVFYGDLFEKVVSQLDSWTLSSVAAASKDTRELVLEARGDISWMAWVDTAQDAHIVLGLPEAEIEAATEGLSGPRLLHAALDAAAVKNGMKAAVQAADVRRAERRLSNAKCRVAILDDWASNRRKGPRFESYAAWRAALMNSGGPAPESVRTIRYFLQGLPCPQGPIYEECRGMNTGSTMCHLLILEYQFLKPERDEM